MNQTSDLHATTAGILDPKVQRSVVSSTPACNPCDWPELAGGRIPESEGKQWRSPRNAGTANPVLSATNQMDWAGEVSGDVGGGGERVVSGIGNFHVTGLLPRHLLFSGLTRRIE